MNWTKYITLSIAVRRFACLFCALFLTASIAWAESEEADTEVIININGEDSGIVIKDGVLIIGKENDEGEPVETPYDFKDFDDDIEDIEELEDLILKGIVIEDKGILSVSSGTALHLGNGGYIAVQEGGVLRLFTSEDTSIHSWVPGSGTEDEEGELEEGGFTGQVSFLLDGGTIEIVAGEGDVLTGEAIIIVISPNGGTVDITEKDLVFKSGGVSGGQTGDLLKTGSGTWEIDGTVTMGGTFDIQEGTVNFHEAVMVSTGVINVGNSEEDDFTATANFYGTANIGVLNVGKIDIKKENKTITNDDGEEEEIEIETEHVLSTGTVTFKEDTTVGKLNITVGKLNIYAGTVDAGHNTLTVQEGGIKGTLKAGHLIIATATSGSNTLTFAGGTHEIGKITIKQGATLDMQAGTTIILGLAQDDEEIDDDGDEDEEDEEGEIAGSSTPDVTDILVQGTLKISSAAGFDKEDGNIRITLNGSDSGAGALEIYKDESDEVKEFGDESIHIDVLGSGSIKIESGVTFTSGNITWNDGGNENVLGADLVVSGGGIYQAGDVDLGEGDLVLKGEGTTMSTTGSVEAGRFISESDTHFSAGGDADFISVQIAGTYDGGEKLLTIQNDGWVLGGKITNVDVLKLGGGTLYLDYSEDDDYDDDTPIISVKSLEAEENTQIRMFRGETKIYKNIIEITESNESDLLDIIKMLNTGGTALYDPVWDFGTDDTHLTLDLTIYSVENYIRAGNKWNKRGANIENVGKLLDRLSVLYPDLRGGLEELSDAQLRGIIQHTMAGELVGNAMRFAMHQPANAVFRHLDNIAPLRSPFANYGTARGQVREGFNVWFNSYGQAEKARSDGNTFDGYDMSRYGFFLGGDIELYNRAVAGVLFGYANPYMKNDLGKISANDYTAGVYLRMPTVWDVSLNTMVGFGSQDYHFSNSWGKTKFNGSSLFGSIELSRPFLVYDYAVSTGGRRTAGRLTPLIALDFQTAAMDGFYVIDPYLGGIRIEPDSLDSTAIRIGVLGELWRIRTRLQYTRQIAGDDFVTSSTSFMWDTSSTSVPIRSVQWGKDWLNAGIGYEFLATRHWHIFADYDFGLGKRTTSHLGAVNAVLKW